MNRLQSDLSALDRSMLLTTRLSVNYLRKNIRNRMDKPSDISKESFINFNKNNIPHRRVPWLPAFINTRTIFEYVNFSWYKDGKKHNIYGPAVVETSGTCYYYIHGIEYTKNVWEVERLKYLKEYR